MYYDDDWYMEWILIFLGWFLVIWLVLFLNYKGKNSTEKPEKPFIVVGKEDRQNRGDFVNYEYVYMDKNGNRYTFIDSKKYGIGDTLGK